jgi:hypothetical protein
MSVATPTVAQAVLKAVKVAKDPEFDRNVLGSLRKAEDHHVSKTLAATTAGGASPAGNGADPDADMAATGSVLGHMLAFVSSSV